MTDEEQPRPKRSEKRGRPRIVKYPNQAPNKRLKGARLSMYVSDEAGAQLEALAAYRGTSKTEVMETLLAYEYRRLVLEGKITEKK